MLLNAGPMIPKSISNKVLIVGPDYRNHKGGVGAVIGMQKPAFEVFNFIPTYRPYNSNLTKSLFFVVQAFRISFYLASHRTIRIVHIHSSQDGSFFRKLAVMFICKKIFGKRIINHTHASHFHRFYQSRNNLVKKTIRYYLQKCDVTLTVSESWRKYYAETFGLPRVHKLVNLAERKQPMLRLCSANEENKPVRFLFLGRIGDRKGIFDLLEVLHLHKDELQGRLTLAVGGDGETERLQKEISAKNLTGMVQYVGWIVGKEKDALLQSSDVFVLPSYDEGMPISVLEAMGYGKPVISTAIGGIPEIVHHNRNGFLLQPGDKTALFTAIQHYIHQPETILQHGTQSLQMIKDFYPESVIPQLEAVYTSLL